MATENPVEEKLTRRQRRDIRKAASQSQSTTPSGDGKGEATPSRRDQEKSTEGNAISRTVRGIVEYFRDVQGELEKVAWPTREEAIRLTRIVLITTIAAALLFGAFSLVADAFMRLGLGQPLIFAVLFVGLVGFTLWYMRRDTAGRSY